jgi:hypothetical protein
LQHRQQLVAQEPAEADLQERARRNVIAVEDREIFALVIFSASLILPAFACRLCVRIVQVTPTSSQNALNSGRRPSSSTWIEILSAG